jgi:phosphoglycolate phosphatase
VIKGVLFDLDGTLLDTAPDLVASLNYLRNGLGLAAMPIDDLRHFVSRGARGLIKAGMPPCDEETLSKWLASFLVYYEKNSFIHSQPFDGVKALLSELEGRNIPWGIVTNKMEYLSFPIIEKAGWASSAAAVVCGDTLENNKPHPAPVLAACQMMGVAPENTLMVGDDIRDIEAGRRAGSRTAFVLYGYADSGSHSDIIGDAALIKAPQEVLELLEIPGPGV